MKFMKKIFAIIFMTALCLALTSAGCETVSGGGSGTSGDGLGLEGALPSVNTPASEIRFMQSKFTVLASQNQIDLRNWVVPVPSNYQLPEITFSLSGNNDMNAQRTSVYGNNLTPGSDSPYSWTLTATPKNGGTRVTATLEVVLSRPGPSYSSDNSVTGGAQLSGRTYVTQNRVNGGETPWYAIHFISDTQLGIGKCSIVRPNAIKLARAGSGGSGGSTGKTVTYTYDATRKVFTMNESVNIIGGEFVINGNNLKNIFMADPIDFNEVPNGANDL